jgi:hypothetical protein
MNTKIFALAFLVAAAHAAPNPDAEADPAYGHALGHGYAHVAPVVHHPAPKCNTVNDILTTQNCVPTTENVCTMMTVDTEEIEYVPLCKETTDHLCDAPVAHVAHHGHGVYKREADADADAIYGLHGGYGHGLAAHHGYAGHHAVAHVAPAPVVASAVGHSVTATVKHACRDVTTEHCVDNPTVKVVPVEVEHCHVITKVTCTDVENLIPVTTCEAVTTTHVSEAVVHAPVAPVVHHAPVGYAHHAAPVVAHHAGYAGHY